MKTNINFQEAISILEKVEIPKLGKEKIFFGNSDGRVIANDVLADENMPKFETSSMDGYAFCFDDLEILKAQGLFVSSKNPAGDKNSYVCKKGECIKTFTGSRMPQNTDSLVLVEDVEVRDDRIFIKDGTNIKKGQWIRAVGENYKKGEVLIPSNTKISAFEIALLAQLNKVFIEVYRVLKIGILSGGDEIIEVGEESKNENTIRNTNAYLIASLIKSAGAKPTLYPLLKDSKEGIKTQVSEAIKDCDIVITTGGMSKGDFDYTQEVIEELSSLNFKGVKIKPGKPVAFGSIVAGVGAEKFIFGLPGSPNACGVTFLLFVRVIIDRLMGVYSPMERLKAVLLEDVSKQDPRLEFRICNLKNNDGRLEVGFWDKKTLQSSVINNFNEKSALLVLDRDFVAKGSEVDIIRVIDLIKS